MTWRRLLGTLVVLTWAMPAGAATVTIGGTPVDDQGSFSTVAGATTVDFNALTPGTQDVVAGIASYTSVNIFSCACSSTGDLLDDTTIGARAFASDDFAIDFSQPLSYFGLYWGSPDPGNLIRIFNGDTELVSFSGKELLSLGVTEGLSGAAYVNFFAGPGESFTRVEITGTEYPFETDNHAFEVVDPLVFISDLITTIQTFGLSAGPTNAFTSKLDAAAAALARNNTNAACGQLGAFINSLSAGRGLGLTTAQVQLAQNKANQLESIVGCR